MNLQSWGIYIEIRKIYRCEEDEISDEETEFVKDDNNDNDQFVENDQTVEQTQASKITMIETRKGKVPLSNFKIQSKDEKSENVEISHDDTENINDDAVSNSFEGVEVGKTKEHRHGCKICLKFFVRKATLDRHMEIVHLKTQTSICNICDKRFESKDGLKIHMKMHDQSHPSNFKCPECSKVYTHSSDLNKHMKMYHSDESKTFSCDCCDFITNRRDTLYKHERVYHDQHYRDFKAIQETLKTNTKLKCFDCGKKFETAADIENHIVLNGCKENKCQHCGKTFNVRHNLLQHIREVHEVTEKFARKIM